MTIYRHKEKERERGRDRDGRFRQKAECEKLLKKRVRKMKSKRGAKKLLELRSRSVKKNSAKEGRERDRYRRPIAICITLGKRFAKGIRRREDKPHLGPHCDNCHTYHEQISKEDLSGHSKR